MHRRWIPNAADRWLRLGPGRYGPRVNVHQWRYVRLWAITLTVTVALLIVAGFLGGPVWVLVLIAVAGVVVLGVQAADYVNARRRGWPTWR